MKTAARRLLASALAALTLLASPALRADDWEARVKISPDTLIRGVSIPSAFKGLDGKSQPAGLYDLKLHKGTQGILIGLLRNGKTVGEFPGKFVPGAADPPGGSQGHDISVRKAGGAQDIHFDGSSKVAFGEGGGTGKISCSNNLHPGGANLGSIQFQLPAVPVQGK
jgi:hypothetical protein